MILAGATGTSPALVVTGIIIIVLLLAVIVVMLMRDRNRNEVVKQNIRNRNVV